MTALAESIRYAVEKQWKHAIQALREGDLNSFAEILGELRTNQLLIEHAIADLAKRAAQHNAPIPIELPNRDGDPDAVPV